MDKEADLWLRKAVKSSGDKIEESAMFISVVSKDFKEDPLCALQLGIALLLDKPIGIIALKGCEIPDNLAGVAKAIEIIEGDDIQAAGERLIKSMKPYLRSDS